MKRSMVEVNRVSRGFARSALCSAVLLGITTGGVVFAADNGVNEQVANALKGEWGQIKFNVRYRYEHIEQDGLKSTNGDPIRLKLGYQTPELYGFQAYAEFIGSTPVFANDYNNKKNGKTEYAVISDPDEAALNQAWLSYKGVPDSEIKGGRLKITYDNWRFIGTSNWRQLEQSYDAITLFNSSLGDLSASVTWVWNVLSGTDQDMNMKSPFVNLRYDWKSIGSLSAYGYWLDYNDADASGPSAYVFSTQTVGVHFSGSPAVTKWLKLLYTAEYANQVDYGDNPKDYSANYYHIFGGVVAPNSDSLFTNITGKVCYEVLGSDDGVPLQTPLGSNHKFNGTADMFSAKPANGIRDLYGVISTAIAGVNVELVYHDFQADEGGSDYGSEIDVNITKKFAEHYTIYGGYANYNADEYKNDVQKFYLVGTVQF